MAVFRKPGSQFWQFKFQLANHRFSGSTKCTSEREAREIEKAERDKALELVSHMRATRRRPLTVGTAFDRWLAEHGSQLADDSTKRDLAWLRAQLGEQQLLHEITDDMVAHLVQLRRAHVIRAGRDDQGKQLYRPITARTVNKSVIDVLRRVMRRARSNWNAVLLCEPTWKNHRLREHRRPIREISAAEERRLDASERHEYALLRRFAIITGLRSSELLLTWPQVDFEGGVFRVIAKGGIPRILPLSREAFAILWSLRGNHPTHVFTYIATRTKKGRDGKALRIKGQRYPITSSGFKSHKSRAWPAAGVDARIHDLRHTAAMRMLRKTGNLKHAQKLLGHSTIAITAKHYTDATLEDLREAMDRTSDLGADPAPQLLEHKKTSESE